MMDLHAMAGRAREAAWVLAASPIEKRNAALEKMAQRLEERRDEIFAANALGRGRRAGSRSGRAAAQPPDLREEKLRQVAAGLRALAALPDPIGQTTLSREITPGLNLYRVTCPIGVIGVIFESRPDALVQIASLALKSGNAALLKGGREAGRTNAALCVALRLAARAAGLPEDFAQLLETREDVAAMLKEDPLIALIIPRGSNAFVRYIMDNSRIPVLGHAEGLCHGCGQRRRRGHGRARGRGQQGAERGRVQRHGNLLVHRDIAPRFLPPLARAMEEKGVRLRGDERVRGLIDCAPATQEDWSAEYLDYILSIRVVDSLDEAIAHINRYGSHHTDCIVTADDAAASRFSPGLTARGVPQRVPTALPTGLCTASARRWASTPANPRPRPPWGWRG